MRFFTTVGLTPGGSSTSHIYTQTVHLHTNSSVGISTVYKLDGPGNESRWEVRYFALVQTSPGAEPSLLTLGTGSFPGVQWQKRGADHQPPF
jgi:hypothetical protein